MRTRAIVAGAVAAGLLAGCGGGDDKGSSGAGRVPGDERIAAAAVLEPTDFPGGWTGREVPVNDAASRCPGSKQAREAASGYAPAPVFSNDRQGSVTQTIEVFGDVAGARRNLAAQTAPAERSCSARRLRARVAKAFEGVKLGKATTRREEFDLPQIDQAVVVSLNVPVADKRSSGGVGGISLTFRVGRALAVMTFTNPNGEFDSELRNQAIAVTTIRLRRELEKS